jgi:glycerol-3-phosphate dehydrogenase
MRNPRVTEKPRQFECLDRERFDVLIIGGGITGAGTARDLALRGVRVALVEQHDFAFGTSSRSTKLVHGGLRYLEQMAFGLVFESCRERYILQQIAPHLVRPTPLIIPLYRGARRSPALVRSGLLFYDLLAVFRNTHWHRMLTAAEARRRQPVLDPEGLRGAALYWDCRMDDARLCLENALAAREAGAVTVNYARVTQLRSTRGHLTGVVVHDQESGAEVEVSARVIVNATGPWLDQICALEETTRPKLHPTRGSHILVPRISPAEESLYLSSEQDDRLFFVIPWGDLSLIGTTDIDIPAVESDPQATTAEINYLLTESRNYLPNVHLDDKDVIASFAGLRPLLAHSGTQTSKASREHAIFESRSGLISIGGGKYTTYRSMAAELADRIMTRLGREREPAPTARIPLPGGATGAFDRYVGHQLKVLRQRYALDPTTLRRLFDRYGSRTPHLLSLLDAQPQLVAPVSADLPLLELEVVYAMTFEMARTAEDIGRRRTSLVLERGRDTEICKAIGNSMNRHGHAL